MKQEDLPSQGQEAQEAPMKSEEEKPEGLPGEPKALHHPAGDDTQEGLPSQASASSNAAPAETKEEENQELPPTTPAGEGQPPEAEAWENRKREVPPPSRQPGKAQGKGEYLLERRTPAQRYVDDYTLQRQRNRPGKKARAQRVPPMPPPAKRAAHPGWGHEEWEGWQQWGDKHWSGEWSSSWWGATRDWDQAPSSSEQAAEVEAMA